MASLSTLRGAELLPTSLPNAISILVRTLPFSLSISPPSSEQYLLLLLSLLTPLLFLRSSHFSAGQNISFILALCQRQDTTFLVVYPFDQVETASSCILNSPSLFFFSFFFSFFFEGGGSDSPAKPNRIVILCSVSSFKSLALPLCLSVLVGACRSLLLVFLSDEARMLHSCLLKLSLCSEHDASPLCVCFSVPVRIVPCVCGSFFACEQDGGRFNEYVPCLPPPSLSRSLSVSQRRSARAHQFHSVG